MSHVHALPEPAAHTDAVADQAGHAGLEVSAVLPEPTQVTLRLHGEMDLANADLLTAVLASHLERGCHVVGLDLSELGFLDCAGLRAIIDAHNRCLAAHGTLILTGMTAQIARILAITRLDETLLIADGKPDSQPRARRAHLAALPIQ
jgi:anti-anti-sigma factor